MYDEMKTSDNNLEYKNSLIVKAEEVGKLLKEILDKKKLMDTSSRKFYILWHLQYYLLEDIKDESIYEEQFKAVLAVLVQRRNNPLSHLPSKTENILYEDKNLLTNKVLDIAKKYDSTTNFSNHKELLKYINNSKVLRSTRRDEIYAPFLEKDMKRIKPAKEIFKCNKS
ncbi:hypothetical protein L3V83_05470 [Thiotrichales bacterium 19X7-9]|nr:hypothetical protein [Thiotrichales bacterium 19X7-9]